MFSKTGAGSQFSFQKVTLNSFKKLCQTEILKDLFELIVSTGNATPYEAGLFPKGNAHVIRHRWRSVVNSLKWVVNEKLTGNNMQDELSKTRPKRMQRP
jgi:hypothetical protein